MKVKVFGTRGSISVSSKDKVGFGGNTTCLQIISDRVPKGEALVVDTGTGFVPLSTELMCSGVRRVNIIYTHWHHDHTLGITMAPHTHAGELLRVFGPKEYGMGPAEVFSDLMKPPHFPVAFAKVRHRFKCHPLEHIGTEVLVIHPEGGVHKVPVHQHERETREGKRLCNGKYPLGECLVVRMLKTAHPENTVSYKFEEMSSGRVFVFLTDHEKMAAFPQDLLRHVKGAHLLIQDGQYADDVHRLRTAGFGHGTPTNCADLAMAAGVEALGITHHDPNATDEEVGTRLEEACAHIESKCATGSEKQPTVFACRDYQEVEV